MLTHSSDKLTFSGADPQAIFQVNGNLVVTSAATFKVEAGTGIVNTTATYNVNGVRVVTAQQSAVANALTSGAATAADCAARLNELLARVRVHGLIAP